jgi:hypothetical protein
MGEIYIYIYRFVGNLCPIYIHIYTHSQAINLVELYKYKSLCRHFYYLIINLKINYFRLHAWNFQQI